MKDKEQEENLCCMIDDLNKKFNGNYTLRVFGEMFALESLDRDTITQATDFQEIKSTIKKKLDKWIPHDGQIRSDTKMCPCCNHTDSRLWLTDSGYFIRCHKCEFRGAGNYGNKDSAIEAWNEFEFSPSQKPYK